MTRYERATRIEVVRQLVRAIERERDMHVPREHLPDELHLEPHGSAGGHHAPPHALAMTHRSTCENDARGSSPNPAMTGSLAAALPVYFATYSAAACTEGTGTMYA